jgi:PAS domain S-box-containing protein
MKQNQLSALLLNQNTDLFWIIDQKYQLIYANETFLNHLKEVTGVEKKLKDSTFFEGFEKSYILKWKSYYAKALNGTQFEIEEQSYDQNSDRIKYTKVTFKPLQEDDQKIFAVACHSKDITRIITPRSEADQMIDPSLDVFCTGNEEGKCIYASAASLNHWGYSPEELIGKSYKDLILDEDLYKTNELMTTILSGQNVKSFMNRYRKKDGAIAYNLWSIRWDAKTKLMHCVVRDAKEILEQEEKILRSEQRFKALIQECSDLIRIFDSAGNFVYVSPTSTAILGIEPGKFIGRNVLEFIHPDDVEKFLSSFQQIQNIERLALEPYRIQNHKKEWRWFETVLTNMSNNPAVGGIVASSRDITTKIKEKQHLKLLESVITNTKDAILITEAEPFTDPGPKIIFVNEAFTKMTGYTAEEVIGKTPRILQGPNSNKDDLSRLGQSIRKWETSEVTTINYKKNGDEFWINFTVTPVADEKGRYTHWIAIERDITEQKIIELENALLAQISVDFKVENDYAIAANELCKSISEIGNFEWVELWTSNLEKNKMLLFSHYVAKSEDEVFYDNSSENLIYQKSEGLSNKTWTNGVQLLWSTVEKYDGFARGDAAKKIGLKSIMGIPLIYNNETVGVLKIGTKKSGNYLNNYIPIFSRLEGFIGSELNRKKLENDLSQMLNSIPDIICVLDFQQRFLKINKSGCDLLGCSEVDILYHNFDEFAHLDHKEILKNKLKTLKKDNDTFKFENRYITKSGSTIWLSWYCNSNVKEGLIYATAKNITEEKKLKELNREARNLAKIGSWEVNLKDKSVYWSDEVHKMHETDPKSFAPDFEEAIQFYRDDFQELVKLNITRCISTGEQTDFEAVLITAKKKEIWVRAIANAEFINGECKRIYGSFQDISDRKESEIRLQSLSNNIPGVVLQYLLYPDGTDTIKYITKGSQEVWGFSADEVMQNIQLVWDRIAEGGEMEKLKKSITDCVSAGTKWTAQWKYVMPNGEIRTHLGCASPSYLADGTVLFDGVILDVTKEAANEALLEQYTYELERSNEELEQFAFVASHDLQEPLRMITSFMELLERKYGEQLDEKAHQYIHFATDGAKRMKQIILDLLDYSRANKSEEGQEEVDMNELVTEFKQLRRKIIAEKSVSIKCKNLPVLHTYKVAIMQILNCLLDNSLKYTESGTSPKVEIKAVENEKEWEFSIKDNGIGIEPQFYDKIFIIFQRLHNNATYSGTGIGLSIAKKHVEFLGGRIWVESVPLKGSVFYFVIPKIK